MSGKPQNFFNESMLLPQLHEVSRGLLLPLLDILSILIVPLCQSRVSLVLQHRQQYLAFWAVVTIVTVLLIHSYSGYRHWEKNRGSAAKLAVSCCAATATAMLTVAYLLGHEHAVTWNWTVAELALPPLLLVFTRGMADANLVAPMVCTGPLVVCADACPADLTTALAEQNLPARAAGILYLADPAESRAAIWPVIPSAAALLQLVRGGGVKDVVFIYQQDAAGNTDRPRRALLSDLLAFPVRIWLAFSLAPELPHPLVGGAGRYRLMPLANERLVNSLNLAKRSFDIAVGALLLSAAMPLLAVIALAVRLEGRGPVVFRQKRIGAHGQQFNVLKFRTMKHAITPFAQAARGDARVTRIGRFLRRTSLDELLQLVNVIRGEMSLVGPRPHAPETQVQGIDFEKAVQYYRLRHRVRPGMTGLAQIRGHRGETALLETLEQRIASDLEYINTWSLWLDVLIILRTLPTLIGDRNAY